jgi:GTP-binding protein Era
MSNPVIVSRSGYVAIIGRANVGKSTLLNRLVGQKVSITSRKPQTTRHRILGISTRPGCQAIYVDTPGLHPQGRRAINRYMNRQVLNTIQDVHLILFMVEGWRWTEGDRQVLAQLNSVPCPVVLVINKVDKIADKRSLLPRLQILSQQRDFAALIPVSALRDDNLGALEANICRLLPESAPFYPEEQITDRTERFLAAEFIREKLMRHLGDEIPYALTVEIKQFSEQEHFLDIAAVIWMERQGQKAIVIGKGGSQLKRIGTEARREMEVAFQDKVFLQLWVKVKEGWPDDEQTLRRFGYD